MQYTDETPMPFGKHKGTPLKDVPPSYLLWLYDNVPTLHEGFKQYINYNRHILDLEVIADKQKQRYSRI